MDISSENSIAVLNKRKRGINRPLDGASRKRPAEFEIHNETRFIDIWPHLIQMIVKSDGSSMQHSLTTKLMMTGDVQLRKQLGYAMTDSYKLRSTCVNHQCSYSRTNSRVRFSEYLHLPNITSLDIGGVAHSSKFYLIDKKFCFLAGDLKALPPRLKKLSLGWHPDADFYNKWALQSNILRHIPNAENLIYLRTVCTIRKRDWIPFSGFKNLQTLCIMLPSCETKNPKWFITLPPTLTSLSCVKYSIRKEKEASSLPRSLLNLELHSWHSDVPMLPHLNSLSHLSLQYHRPAEFSLLPPALSVLRIQYMQPMFRQKSLHLSSNLTDIEFGNYCRIAPMYPSGLMYIRHDVVISSLEGLSPNTLSFSSCSSTLRCLNLHLNCSLDESVFHFDAMVSLVSLKIYAADIENFEMAKNDTEVIIPILKLPQSVETLSVTLANIRPFDSSQRMAKISSLVIVFHNNKLVMPRLRCVRYTVEGYFPGPPTFETTWINIDTTLLPALTYFETLLMTKSHGILSKRRDGVGMNDNSIVHEYVGNELARLRSFNVNLNGEICEADWRNVSSWTRATYTPSPFDM